MRLDKALANAGVGSRSLVKELIRKGKVTVNGETITAPEAEVAETDVFTANGAPVAHETFTYLLLYKPAGYLTARSDARKPVVMSLLGPQRPDLSPVGRLDEDTEGALLFTNDGLLAHQLLSPKKKIEKVYYAELDGDLPEDAAERLSVPIAFKDFTAAPALLEKRSERSALLTVHEGKYHEVKRLFHHIGCEVTFLRRESFAGIGLEGLKTGEFRPLTEEEIKYLREIVK